MFHLQHYKMLHGAALRSKLSRVMTSKNRVTINLSEDEHAALDHLATNLKVSKAWLGRQAIAQMIERAQNDEAQLPLPLVRLREREGW